MPSDGQVDPSQLAQAMASGARKAGVKFFTHTRVLEIRTAAGRVTSVLTDKGEIECDVVVNCGGMYAPSIARMVGVRVPIIPMSHQYLITENFLDPQAKHLPSLRDPDNLIYFRQEVSGLLMGGYERNSKSWTADHTHFDDIPADFNGRLLSEEWDRFEEIAINSQKRVPAMEQVGVKNFINGPEGFTPDNEFCLGETEVGGFFVAAGFCAHGIAGAGGIGKVVAEWVITGEPQMDLWHMDIRRFGAAYKSPSFTLKRTQENYESYYDLHYPGEERKSARPLKTSPAYPWHLARGAVFGEKSGWERVNYYKDHETDDELKPYGWAGHYWSSAVAVEHHATRTHAGLFDESSFAKISVSGERAGDFLNHVCANDVVRGVGRATYTQALTTRGGIECDFTVTQTSENAFFIVTGTAFGTHDLGWLKKQRRELGFGEVVLEDVTGAYACFGLWGPNARKILEKLTPQDVSNEGFPFMTSREISIGDIPARATRITYVGELGWEFYVSTEFGAALWKLLFEAGEALGLMACGYKAIESLRLEKGYRAWGGEINTETNPWEAGLGFAISKSKAEFIGREQLLAHKEKISRFLVAITFDDIRCVPLGNEPIRVNNQIIGRMKSGGQGYTIEKAIGYAYLPIEQATNGNKVEVEFFGAWEKGNVAVTPLFDAMNERIKS